MKKIYSCVFLLFTHVGFSQNPLAKQWDYTYGGNEQEVLYSLGKTKDGGFILGGVSLSDSSGNKTQPTWGLGDYWVVKTDSLGLMQWEKRFGSTEYDNYRSTSPSYDGGYVIGGFTKAGISGDKTQESWGEYDYWIVRTDSNGNLVGDKRFGGIFYDGLRSLDVTADGGCILGGESISIISGNKTQSCWGNSEDYWMVKTGLFGNFSWDKRFGGTEWDYFSAIRQTPDKGYILGGWSNSGISGDKTQSCWGVFDYWIVKTDSLGDKEWDKRYGGSGLEIFADLQPTSDGGYILGGTSDSEISGDKTQEPWGSSDYWIVKINSAGSVEWDRRYGGTGGEVLCSVQQTTDGGFILGGYSSSGISGDKTEDNLGYKQSWIVKIDSVGNKQWDKTIFSSGNCFSGFVTQVSDKCYVVANHTSSGIGGYKTQPNWGDSTDYWIIKFCDTSYSSLFPHSLLNCSNTSFCEKLCIDFFDASSNNPTAWHWEFPGGTPSSSNDQHPVNICYDYPGTFDVTLTTTNSYGSDTLTLFDYITVYPTPPFPTITQTGYTLTSSPAPFYQWQFNSVDISGATNQSYTASQTGLYSVMVSDSNGCKNSATVYVLITTIEELSGDFDFSIFPNPSNGNFIVELFNSSLSGVITIEIHNTLGQVIFSEKESPSIATAFKKEIDLKSVTPGIYFIGIKNNANLVMKKLILSD